MYSTSVIALCIFLPDLPQRVQLLHFLSVIVHDNCTFHCILKSVAVWNVGHSEQQSKQKIKEQSYFHSHLFLKYSSPSGNTLYPSGVKGKAIPLQALPGPEGSRRLRLPDFKPIGTRKWQGCQPYAPAAFNPRKYSWYSFLLEAESTPGP
jgi:hypothetical protein